MRKTLFSIFALLLTMVTQGAWAWDGSGTAQDPYLIKTRDDWAALVESVSAGNTYHGTYFAQEGIDVDAYFNMVGTSEYPFEGTYDGRGNILRLRSCHPTESDAALFRYVNGATIQNLNVCGGDINASVERIGGIVANASGNTTIRNCTSDLMMSTSCASRADLGGIVAYVNSGATVNVINCAYTYRIIFSNENGYGGGGIVGWVESGATANITNCTVGVSYSSDLPSADKQFYMFANGDNGCVVNISNSFYTQAANDSGAYPQDGSKLVPTSIYSNADWEDFCDVVASGYDYHNNSFQKTVELFSNISVTKVAGATNRPFRGMFDGRSHQIEVNINVESDDADTPAALFAELRSPAIIQNLNVTGTITTNGRRPASIASFVSGSSTTITNCLSSVDITSTYGGDIDAGAFVGRVNEDKELTMNGCVFTGSITYTNANGYEGGGFVGWLQGKATSILTNCLFAPTSLNFTKAENDFHTFAGGYGARNHTYCYYNDVAAGEEKITTTEGKRLRSISKGDGVATFHINESVDPGPLVFGFKFYNPGVGYNDVLYAGAGDAVPLWIAYAARTDLAFRRYNTTHGTLANETTNTPTLTMANADATLGVDWLLPVDNNAYCIATKAAWDVFCDMVDEGYYDDNKKPVKMTDDVSGVSGVTKMLGTEAKPFAGTFDGQGHTLTVNIDNTTADNAGPFSVVNAATIRNLKIAGSITTDKVCIGGIVGKANGQVVIENCSSSVAMTPTYNSGAGFVGGIVGRAEGANGERTAISGCAFTGSITLNNPNGYMGGGMVGWKEIDEYEARITNCVFAPTSLDFISAPGKYVFSMFVSGNGTKNFTNSYYSDVAAGQPIISTIQGKQMRSINAGFGVSSVAISGASTVYDASGITSYSAGFKYNDVCYAGNEDQVNLTLTHADKGFVFEKYTVEAGGGTLTSPTTNTPKLTMTDAEQTLVALWTLPVEEGASLIASKEAWDVFCVQVTNGNTYSGQTVKLTSDLNGVTMLAGAEDKPFSGTFDGQGNTLDVDINVESDDIDTPAAPFAELSGAMIQNLNISGSITTNGMRPASVAGIVSSASTISNCRSSVAITSSRTGDIDAGAFVGRVDAGKILNMSDCFFAGSITYTDAAGYEGGGFVGWMRENASATLTNCVFAPTSLSFTKAENAFYTFVGGKVRGSLTNCYYNDVAAGEEKITTIEGQQIPTSITSPEVWRNFYDVVSYGYDYSGKTVTLDFNNLSVSAPRMVGTQDRPFAGTFDGQGNTLDVDIAVTSGDTNTPAAPFGAIGGATIKNLNVTGIISTIGYRPASIAGIVTENSTVTNCKSNVAITSSYDGYVEAGAFVGRVKANKSLTMEGCVFTGSITYSHYNGHKGGGLVGALLSHSSATLSNCVFAPSNVSIDRYTDSDFYMFVGGNDVRGTLTNCYYNDVAAGYSRITKEGKQMRSISAGTDVTTLTISGESITEYSVSGITAYNAGTGFNAGIKYNDVYYAGNEDAVPLSLSHADAPTGKAFGQYTVAGGGTIANPSTDTPTLTMSDANQTVNAACLLTIISSTDDWNTFAASVSSGFDYSGLTVELTDNVTVTPMAGALECPFAGTFVGNGHTMTLAIDLPSGDNVAAAPFGALKGAHIRNLNVTGSITTNGIRPASIASFVTESSIINNCKSSVAITSSYAADIDAGAFVARVNEGKTLTMNGCVFTGSINYSTVGGYEGGGFVGFTQSGAIANLSNCVFAPTSLGFNTADNKFYMFVGGNERGTLTNCYYNTLAYNNIRITTKEGKRMRTISAGTDVTGLTISGETIVEYSVSGITAYVTSTGFNAGIKYNDVYYAGNEEAVPLSLSHADAPAGYAFSQYAVVGGGTIANPSTDTPTLTMSDANQTINAEWIQAKAITLADNADNSEAISGAKDQVANVTLSGRTLYKDGKWNTICLPFSLSAAQIAAHAAFAGATLKTLDTTQKNGFDTTDGTLYLGFKTATEIEAGVPYLVKWTSGDNISNPVFEGVTINSAEPQAVESETVGLEIVQMVGTYSPVSVTANDKSILFLSDANTLYYSSIDRQLRSCRAYFSVPYINGNAGAEARAFVLNFDDEEATGISLTPGPSTESEGSDCWYTIDGRKLSSKPSQRGMYINKGKVILVK